MPEDKVPPRAPARVHTRVPLIPLRDLRASHAFRVTHASCEWRPRSYLTSRPFRARRSRLLAVHFLDTFVVVLLRHRPRRRPIVPIGTLEGIRSIFHQPLVRVALPADALHLWPKARLPSQQVYRRQRICRYNEQPAAKLSSLICTSERMGCLDSEMPSSQFNRRISKFILHLMPSCLLLAEPCPRCLLCLHLH